MLGGEGGGGGGGEARMKKTVDGVRDNPSVMARWGQDDKAAGGSSVTSESIASRRLERYVPAGSITYPAGPFQEEPELLEAITLTKKSFSRFKPFRSRPDLPRGEFTFAAS